jgi:hypothetical protein
MTKLVQFNGTWYQLVRTIKVSQVGDNMDGLKAWRDILGCDHVLRNGEQYLMVRYVEDAKIISE